jgi:hypothetical protein
VAGAGPKGSPGELHDGTALVRWSAHENSEASAGAFRWSNPAHPFNLSAFATKAELIAIYPRRRLVQTVAPAVTISEHSTSPDFQTIPRCSSGVPFSR